MSVSAWLRWPGRPSSPPESSICTGRCSAARRLDTPDRPEPSSRFGAAGAHSVARALQSGLVAALLCLPLLGGLATEAVAQTPVFECSTANSDGTYSVPNSWALKPAGLVHGDRFRLLFITATTDDAATEDWIGFYNSFVQTRARANANITDSCASRFKVVGSTARVNARTNAGTTGAGAAIYWLGGDKVANDNADFHDGTWASSAGRTESGASSSSSFFTGSNDDGTAYSGEEIGTSGDDVRTGSAGGGLDGGGNADKGTFQSFLALSPVFKVDQVFVKFEEEASLTVDEGDIIRAKVLMSRARTVDTTLTVFDFDGSATSGTDYEAGSYTLVIPKGQTEATLSIPTVQDKVLETAENTLLRAFSYDEDVVVEYPESVVVTIYDDEYTLTWSQKTVTVPEDAGEVELIGTIDRHLDRDIRLGLEYTDFNAFLHHDYQYGPRVVTVPRGSNSFVVRIPLINDSLFEDNKLFRVTILDPNQPDDTTAPVADIIITDDETERGYVGRDVKGIDDKFYYQCRGPGPALLVNGAHLHPEQGPLYAGDGPLVSPPPPGLVVDWDKDNYEVGETAKITFRTSDGSRLCGDFSVKVYVGQRPHTWQGAPAVLQISGSRDMSVRMNRGQTEVSRSFRVLAPGRPYFRITSSFAPPEDRDGNTLTAATEVSATATCPNCLTVGEPFELTLSTDATSVTEGGEVTVTVTTDPAPTSGLVVNMRAVESMGEGVELIEFDTRNTVTIPAGATTVDWTFTALSDSVERADGTITVSIAPGDGYTAGTPSSVTLTLLDDDGQGVDPNDDQGTQVGGGGTLPAGHPVMKYASLVKSFYDRITARNQHGDGAAGGWNKRFLKAMGHPDYVNYPQAAVTVADATRIWNHGGPGANTAWDGTVDAVTYAEQYFAGQVPTPTAQQQQQQVADPEVTIAAGAGIAEGGSATFVLTATPPPAAALEVTVTIAASGDYGITAGERTVTIPTSGTYTLTLATTGDEVDEPDGSVTATVDAGSGYTVGAASTGTVAIADDDLPPPAVSVAAGSGIVEGGDAVFTVTADRAPDANLSVALTVSEAAGSDFVAAAEGAKTVTILAGETAATLTVKTEDDKVDEPNGSVTATLAAGTGYTVGSASSGTIAVADNDAAAGVLPVLSVESRSVQEGDGKVIVWATIDPLPSKAAFPELYGTTRLKLRTIEGTHGTARTMSASPPISGSRRRATSTPLWRRAESTGAGSTR